MILNVSPPAPKAITTILEFATSATHLVRTVSEPPLTNVLLVTKQDHFFLRMDHVLKIALILLALTRVNSSATHATALAKLAQDHPHLNA